MGSLCDPEAETTDYGRLLDQSTLYAQFYITFLNVPEGSQIDSQGESNKKAQSAFEWQSESADMVT